MENESKEKASGQITGYLGQLDAIYHKKIFAIAHVIRGMTLEFSSNFGRGRDVMGTPPLGRPTPLWIDSDDISAIIEAAIPIESCSGCGNKVSPDGSFMFQLFESAIDHFVEKGYLDGKDVEVPDLLEFYRLFDDEGYNLTITYMCGNCRNKWQTECHLYDESVFWE